MLTLSTDASMLDVQVPDLLTRCKDGEDHAWRALFREYHPFVHRVARRLGTPDDELDDVVQRSFVVVFRKLSSFDDGTFTTWLYRIVANVVSEHHRRRRRRRGLLARLLRRPEEPDDDRTPETELADRQARSEVAAILAAMSDKKRAVFVLYELEQLSGEQIAEIVGCKVDTVWSRLHYARRDFARLARRRHLIEETSL